MKKLMLIDPQDAKHLDPMWVEFYDDDFAMTNGDQYVCEINKYQVLQILNSHTLQIEVPQEIQDKLKIKSELAYPYDDFSYSEYYFEKKEEKK